MPEPAKVNGLLITPGRMSGTPPERKSPVSSIETHPQWPLLARMPLKLIVRVKLPAFRVADLLRLEAGQALRTVWPATEDVPLDIGGVQLAWCEFEVVGLKMAVRLTRLA